MKLFDRENTHVRADRILIAGYAWILDAEGIDTNEIDYLRIQIVVQDTDDTWILEYDDREVCRRDLGNLHAVIDLFEKQS